MIERRLWRLERKSWVLRDLTLRILAKQQLLQDSVSEKSWSVFLDLDDLMNEKASRLIETAIQLALRLDPKR